MQDEIGPIIAKARQSIDAAETLLKDRRPGFAVSRAYYAMFYTAEALLLKKGLAFSKHGAVIAAYGEHFAKPGVLDPVFHQHLIEAFDKRQIGDYAFDEEISLEDARRQISRAASFLDAADRWLTSS